MNKSYVQRNTNHLFCGLDPPLFVYEREDCNVMKFRGRKGILENYRLLGSKKDFICKPLHKLFKWEDSGFDVNNTIIVDHNRSWHFCNCPVNVVLLKRWSREGDECKDSMLVDYILPWIKRLHTVCPVELFSFWKRDSIGELHLAEEEDRT